MDGSWPAYMPKNIVDWSVVIYTVISVGMWWSIWVSTRWQRKSYAAGYRPFVGIKGLKAEREDKAQTFRTFVSFVNLGSVPATNVEIRASVEVNGKALKVAGDHAESGFVLFPRVDHVFMDTLQGAAYQAIVDGNSKTVLKLAITYRDLLGRTRFYKSEYRYAPATNAFLPGKAEAN
jgi:hypothetical protein